MGFSRHSHQLTCFRALHTTCGHRLFRAMLIDECPLRLFMTMAMTTTMTTQMASLATTNIYTITKITVTTPRMRANTRRSVIMTIIMDTPNLITNIITTNMILTSIHITITHTMTMGTRPMATHTATICVACFSMS